MMPSTMTAAVYYGARDIRIEKVPAPRLSAGEALVRVTRVGICGTDASEWVSGPRTFPGRPMIPGHEFIGEVVEAPSDSGFATGDIIASGAGISCGDCRRCLDGRTNRCLTYRTLGLNIDGALAEYVAVPTSTMRTVPRGLDLDHAALAQPLAVGVHAARRARARAGDRIVVIGAGAIGTFVLAGLRHLGELDITVVDLPGPRLDRALRLGADRIVAASEAVVPDVEEALDGRPDVVIEASGAPGQLSTALTMVVDGGRVLAVGVPKENPSIDVHSLVFREVTLETTLAHVCDTDLPAALQILARNPALGTELSQPPVALDRIAQSLDVLARGKADRKILIDPRLPIGTDVVRSE